MSATRTSGFTTTGALLLALAALGTAPAAAQTISIGDATVTEGDAGTVNATFTVSISVSAAATVDWATGTTGTGATHAVSGADFQANSGTVTFTSGGATSQTVTVLVNGDTTVERHETFAVNLSNASGAVINPLADQGTGTINDDDPPTIAIASAVGVTEGNSGFTNAVFAVTLSAASGMTVQVDYDTANGTASQPGDYTSTSDTLTFTPGTTTLNVSVPVKGDTTVELNETFTVTLTAPSNGVLGNDVGTGTINDDDPPDVSVDSVSVTEGNSGTVNAAFTISLSAASGRSITVTYQTVNGTATGGSDFTAIAAGTQVTFAPGQTTKPVNVSVNGDTSNEADETFTLDLTAATNANMAGDGTGTILNDDPPEISINDRTVTEGNSGSVNATFTVSLSNPDPVNTITVDYQTANGTTRPATAGTDYTAASNTLTFTPGQTSKTVTVVVAGDSLYEYDETFFVDLTNANNAVIVDSRGVGTISNDDNPPNLSLNDVTVTEGNSGTVNAAFTITLSTVSGRDTAVDWATANGTAVAPGDYTSLSGTANFNPGETTKTVTIAVNGDTSDEADETFTVGLTTPTNAAISDSSGQGTITDDDAPPALSVNNISVAEGNAGTTAAVFTVSLSVASGRTVTVDYATAAGSANSGSDFSSASGTLTFAAGSTSQTITVSVNGDVTHELDETFFVDLSGSVNATLLDPQGLGTITNDDSLPQLSVADRTVAEGNFGSTVVTFTVTLAPASSQTVTASYATSDGTAVSTSDYQAKTGTVSFSPGTTTQTFTVNVTGDTTPEASETFNVTLASPLNATLSDATGVGTITDDDGSPSITIGDVNVLEGNSGSVNAVLTVSLSTASGLQVTVNYATAAGTALAGSDYTTASGTLTFTPGTRTQSVTVAVAGDLLNELNETFFVNLSGATNATVLDAQGKATIADDDAQPNLTIAADSGTPAAEGDTGTTNAVLTVTLSAASGQAVTAAWTTTAGDATADVDFTAGTGTISIPAGSLSASITIPVAGDLLDEPDETFLVDLSSVVNANLVVGQAVWTIADNDPTPTLTVGDVTVTEGDTGTANATFTVTLSAASGRTVSVSYATTDGGARSPADYTTSAGQLTFDPGTTTKLVTVPVAGDDVDESTETFLFTLSGPVNANIVAGTGTGSITDDDDAPAISVGDVTLAEGSAGARDAVFTVVLSNGSAQTVTVAVDTVDDTAQAGSDYTAVSRTLTFDPEQLSRTVVVPVLGDGTFEAAETFGLQLSLPTNATLGDAAATGTISDDDPAPRLAIGDVELVEGDSGVTAAVFAVTLTGDTALAASVEWQTVDATAIASGDYASAGGSLTFPVGTTARTITVDVAGDTGYEHAERFFVDLGNASGAQIVQGEGWATILNDDGRPTLSAVDLAVPEGPPGTSTATLTVNLSGTSVETVTVSYATANDTALSGIDYTAVTGSLTFAPGQTSRTVGVPLVGNAVDQDDRAFFLNLSTPLNASVLDGQAVATIQDDDALPVLAVGDVSVTEGSGSAVTLTFDVTLTGVTARTVSVEYSTADGAAGSPGDFAGTAGTLSFPPGTTSLPVTVEVAGDVVDEDDETFMLTLANPVNADVPDAVADAVIVDDDAPPSVSIADASIGEGHAGSRLLAFTVTLSEASERMISVQYQTADGTATAPDDYTAAAGPLSFPPGTTVQSVEVEVMGDRDVEAFAETFAVTLDQPVRVVLDDASAVGSIVTDEVRVADLDGDGWPDLLFRHGVDGRLLVWRMKDGEVLGAMAPSPDQNASPAWQVGGTGDFDDDGRADLVWHDADTGDLEVWRMVSGARDAVLAPVPANSGDLALALRCLGDLDGDGDLDLVWENVQTGEISAWVMDGVTRMATAVIDAGSGPRQALLTGAADLTGDGKVDLVWQRGRKVVIWPMDGLVRAGGEVTVAGDGRAHVRLAALADYDGDGNDDLAWHGLGKVEIWYMQGSSVLRTGLATGAPPVPRGFKLVGPR